MVHAGLINKHRRRLRKGRHRRRHKGAAPGEASDAPDAPEEPAQDIPPDEPMDGGDAPPAATEDTPAATPAPLASGATLADILAKLTDPTITKKQRRNLLAAARIAARAQKLADRETTRRDRIDKGVPFMKDQIERLQASNSNLKEYIGIGGDNPAGIGALQDLPGASADVGAAFDAQGAASLLGGDGDLSGLLADDSNSAGGLPSWVPWAAGGAAVLGLGAYLLMRKRH